MCVIFIDLFGYKSGIEEKEEEEKRGKEKERKSARNFWGRKEKKGKERETIR